MQSDGKKVELHHDGANTNLCVEYSHWTVNNMYENVLDNIVKVTNASWVSLAIPYVAISIMENNDSCDGVSVNN